MKIRATSLLAVPVLALLAGCASTGAVTHSTEYDDVYYSSRDRTSRAVAASAAAPATDPTLPPAPDGSVVNPDYNGQGGNGQSANSSANGYSYYNDDYSTGRRYNSPYYNSWNRYGSGYAYDPFWGGSTLAIGCMPGWGWGSSVYTYAPVYTGPRVRFGVSFGWGYSSWAMPMYGYASPYFYDPFWGYGYAPYGYGYGYSPYYSPWYGGGYYGGYYGGGGYYQGFYDGYYAGNNPRRRVTYGPRVDRSSSGFRSGSGYTSNGGTRSSRRDGSSNVTPGAVGGTYNSGGYVPATRVASPADGGRVSQPAVGASSPAASGSQQPATRISHENIAPITPISGQPQEQVPVRSGQMATGSYQPAPRSEQQPAQPVAPPQPTRQSWFERTTRAISGGNSNESGYSAPATRPSGGGGFQSSGGSRSGGGGGAGSSGGGTRRSR